MDQARQNYEMDYLVIVKPIKAEEKYDVMQVASGLFKEEREGQSQREMAIPFLGDMIGSFYPPEFIEEIYKDMHTRYDIKFSTSHTDFGRTYDGAIPIRNKKGEGIALLTAGISLRGINSSMRRYLFITVVCAIILSSIFLTFMLLWLRTRVIIPLKKIEKSAEDFVEKSRSQKDPNVLVLEYPDIHTGDELESLASSLVSMSKNMKEYVEALLASATEMANMKQKVSVMSNIAYRDALTGVKSKAAYDKEKERIDWDIVNHIATFAILMIDLNYLKRINDSFGHEKGDIYIKKISKIICDIFAHSPVYRIGGDEFIIILENRDLETHDSLIQELKTKMEEIQNDKSLESWERVSAAVGLAIYDAS